MQTLWSKKAVMALLVTNLASASYIVKEKVVARPHHKHKRSVASAETPADRHGVVEPVYFKNSNEIQGCYESLLTRSPKRDEGSVLVNLTVTREGNVDNLNLIQSDFEEQKFHDCLLTTIKSTRLPASDDRAGVLIAHRFNFHRKTENKINFDR